MPSTTSVSPFSRTTLMRFSHTVLSGMKQAVLDITSLSMRSAALAAIDRHASHRQAAPIGSGNAQTVDNGESIAAKALHSVRTLRGVRSAMAAPIIADWTKCRAKDATCSSHMPWLVPERVRQHQYRSVLGISISNRILQPSAST